MVKLPDAVERLGPPSKLALSLATVVVLGLIDYWTGYEAFFAIFYLIPIAFATWHASERWGLIFSGLSASSPAPTRSRGFPTAAPSSTSPSASCCGAGGTGRR